MNAHDRREAAELLRALAEECDAGRLDAEGTAGAQLRAVLEGARIALAAERAK